MKVWVYKALEEKKGQRKSRTAIDNAKWYSSVRNADSCCLFWCWVGRARDAETVC